MRCLERKEFQVYEITYDVKDDPMGPELWTMDDFPPTPGGYFQLGDGRNYKVLGVVRERSNASITRRVDTTLEPMASNLLTLIANESSFDGRIYFVKRLGDVQFGFEGLRNGANFGNILY